jgi:hypothetical protein
VLAAHLEVGVALAERRAHQVLDQRRVEVVAGGTDAAGADDVACARAAAAGRAHAHQAEVGGARAEVGDQRQLGPRQRALVVICGGDRLELESRVVEAGQARGRQQAVGGDGVVVGCGAAREAHRPADRGGADRRAQLLLGVLAQPQQEQGDHVVEADRVVGDLRAPQRLGGQVGLERLHSRPSPMQSR